MFVETAPVMMAALSKYWHSALLMKLMVYPSQCIRVQRTHCVRFVVRIKCFIIVSSSTVGSRKQKKKKIESEFVRWGALNYLLFHQLELAAVSWCFLLLFRFHGCWHSALEFALHLIIRISHIDKLKMYIFYDNLAFSFSCWWSAYNATFLCGATMKQNLTFHHHKNVPNSDHIVYIAYWLTMQISFSLFSINGQLVLFFPFPLPNSFRNKPQIKIYVDEVNEIKSGDKIIYL